MAEKLNYLPELAAVIKMVFATRHLFVLARKCVNLS